MRGGNERASLWVDNLLILDQWTSLLSSSLSGTVHFSLAGHLHQVKLEYSAIKYKHNNTGQAVQLRWKGGHIRQRGHLHERKAATEVGAARANKYWRPPPPCRWAAPARPTPRATFGWLPVPRLHCVVAKTRAMRALTMPHDTHTAFRLHRACCTSSRARAPGLARQGALLGPAASARPISAHYLLSPVPTLPWPLRCEGARHEPQ